jgi:hypothetical protein
MLLVVGTLVGTPPPVAGFFFEVVVELPTPRLKWFLLDL